MELIALMLEAGDGPDIYVAVRAEDPLAAQTRVAETLGRLWETPPESIRRPRVVSADRTAAGPGISDSARKQRVANVGRVIHCAASLSFTLPLADAREVN